MFDVILTDPPWFYYGDQTKMGAAGKEYSLMSDEDLLQFRYPLNNPGVLFMWATGPRLDFAIKCMEAQNLFYRGVAFVWIKTTKDGKPIGAQGVRPSIVKPITEFVLVASTKKFGRPLPIQSEGVVQTIFAPKQKHSQKPEEVQNRIEHLYPTQSKAEFFARRHRAGWTCFGDEI
ncbi:MAG: MT-A70 family methyltransferase [Cyanobacteriota bacterium]